MGILEMLGLGHSQNPAGLIGAASPELLPAQVSAPNPYTQVAGNNELENLRRILANDKPNGAKPISPPMSDQQILENLRRLIRENS